MNNELQGDCRAGIVHSFCVFSNIVQVYAYNDYWKLQRQATNNF